MGPQSVSAWRRGGLQTGPNERPLPSSAVSKLLLEWGGLATLCASHSYKPDPVPPLRLPASHGTGGDLPESCSSCGPSRGMTLDTCFFALCSPLLAIGFINKKHPEAPVDLYLKNPPQ